MGYPRVVLGDFGESVTVYDEFLVVAKYEFHNIVRRPIEAPGYGCSSDVWLMGLVVLQACRLNIVDPNPTSNEGPGHRYSSLLANALTACSAPNWKDRNDIRKIGITLWDLMQHAGRPEPLIHWAGFVE